MPMAAQPLPSAVGHNLLYVKSTVSSSRAYIRLSGVFRQQILDGCQHAYDWVRRGSMQGDAQTIAY